MWLTAKEMKLSWFISMLLEIGKGMCSNPTIDAFTPTFLLSCKLLKSFTASASQIVVCSKRPFKPPLPRPGAEACDPSNLIIWFKIKILDLSAQDLASHVEWDTGRVSKQFGSLGLCIGELLVLIETHDRLGKIVMDPGSYFLQFD